MPKTSPMPEDPSALQVWLAGTDSHTLVRVLDHADAAGRAAAFRALPRDRAFKVFVHLDPVNHCCRR